MYGFGLNQIKIKEILGFNLSAKEVDERINRLGGGSADNQEVPYKPFQDGETVLIENRSWTF
eukprot:TRINITY_DN388_c0_g1_i1.p1 TRINITY_DN388_c0_g1~~TRINITY_DN388_c0_g1_i1.p1  ORF type:complete len:62 (+),score=9.54 TRINITY_DN388_c0_g1_i1:200-385(+)